MKTTHRKKEIKELFEGFGSLRRTMAFRPTAPKNMPRITPAQWGALVVIEQSGETTLKDMARALGITSSAATQLIDGLVTSGYVVRKTHAKDRRAVTLTLSHKTTAQVNIIKKQALQKFLTFFDVLNDKELHQYILLNKKIIERLLKNKNI